jgi:hypothetical protein
MVFNNDSNTTPCPECGEDMPLMTWTGKKPCCARCSGATVTNDLSKIDTSLDFDYVDEGEQKCLHEALEESLPENQKGGPHMLVCNCPKCSVI